MLTHLGVSARARDTQEEQWWYEPIVCRPFVLRYPSRGYPGEGNSERSSLETASETTCTGLPEKIRSFLPPIPRFKPRFRERGVLRIRRESCHSETKTNIYQQRDIGGTTILSLFLEDSRFAFLMDKILEIKEKSAILKQSNAIFEELCFDISSFP